MHLEFLLLLVVLLDFFEVLSIEAFLAVDAFLFTVLIGFVCSSTLYSQFLLLHFPFIRITSYNVCYTKLLRLQRSPIVLQVAEEILSALHTA